MALIAVAADKGAPGVTTAAVALAAVWPRPVLLAECDPAGADLPYRLPGPGGAPLAPARGMVSLASAVRGQVGPGVVWEHVQHADGGLPVLVGPASPEQADAMATSWTLISGVLAGLPDADVVADCGRVLGDTPLAPVLRRADLLLLVSRATVDGVAHLRHGLLGIARAANLGAGDGPSALTRSAVLLVADRLQIRQARRQVQQVLANAPGLADVPVIGALAYDEVGARGLSGQWGRRLDRTPLVASAREVASTVDAWVHAAPASRTAPQTPEGVRA